MFKRALFQTLFKRIQEPRRFIQILAGPRQVGKTTLINQVLDKLDLKKLYASADEPTIKDSFWLHQQWEAARVLAKSSDAVLVLDEIQKITDWARIIKKLWDEDTRLKLSLKVILLGSAPLLMQQGLTESLAGRFEQIPVTHWTFSEMRSAFGWSLEQYIYFGGYPGAAELIEDESRWRRYVHDSLIETTLSRDILLLNPIHKPALLRRLFQLGCDYSGQILSYQKMLGQLQDVGNTTTLAHYLELLSGVGMVAGIEKFPGKKIQQRSSSPKLQVYNTALISSLSHRSFRDALKDTEYWGRLVESSVGAYLLNNVLTHQMKLFYWRERDKEVDFILQAGEKIIAIEVKSQYRKTKRHSGTETFTQHFKTARTLLVGGMGLPLKDFLSAPFEDWLN